MASEREKTTEDVGVRKRSLREMMAEEEERLQALQEEHLPARRLLVDGQAQATEHRL